MEINTFINTYETLPSLILKEIIINYDMMTFPLIEAGRQLRMCPGKDMCGVEINSEINDF